MSKKTKTYEHKGVLKNNRMKEIVKEINAAACKKKKVQVLIFYTNILVSEERNLGDETKILCEKRIASLEEQLKSYPEVEITETHRIVKGLYTVKITR